MVIGQIELLVQHIHSVHELKPNILHCEIFLILDKTLKRLFGCQEKGTQKLQQFSGKTKLTYSIGDVVVDNEGAGLLEREREREVGEAGPSDDGGSDGRSSEPDVTSVKSYSPEDPFLVGVGASSEGDSGIHFWASQLSKDELRIGVSERGMGFGLKD